MRRMNVSPAEYTSKDIKDINIDYTAGDNTDLEKRTTIDRDGVYHIYVNNVSKVEQSVYCYFTRPIIINISSLITIMNHVYEGMGITINGWGMGPAYDNESISKYNDLPSFNILVPAETSFEIDLIVSNGFAIPTKFDF